MYILGRRRIMAFLSHSPYWRCVFCLFCRNGEFCGCGAGDQLAIWKKLVRTNEDEWLAGSLSCFKLGMHTLTTDRNTFGGILVEHLIKCEKANSHYDDCGSEQWCGGGRHFEALRFFSSKLVAKVEMAVAVVEEVILRVSHSLTQSIGEYTYVNGLFTAWRACRQWEFDQKNHQSFPVINWRLKIELRKKTMCVCVCVCSGCAVPVRWVHAEKAGKERLPHNELNCVVLPP